MSNSGSEAGVHAEDGLEGIELQLAELDHGRRDVHARGRHGPRFSLAKPVGRAAQSPRPGRSVSQSISFAYRISSRILR